MTIVFQRFGKANRVSSLRRGSRSGVYKKISNGQGAKDGTVN